MLNHNTINNPYSQCFFTSENGDSIPNQATKKAHPRKKFTIEEDEMLKKIVNQHILQSKKYHFKAYQKSMVAGVVDYEQLDWGKIAKEMDTERNPRQCKERWINYLSPDVVNGPWTEEEDQLLIQKYNEIGPFWKLIAKFFPTRTDINIKSRWNLRMRQRRKIERIRNKAIQKQIEKEKSVRNKLVHFTSHVRPNERGIHQNERKIGEFADEIVFSNNDEKYLSDYSLKISCQPLPFVLDDNSRNNGEKLKKEETEFPLPNCDDTNIKESIGNNPDYMSFDSRQFWFPVYFNDE